MTDTAIYAIGATAVVIIGSLTTGAIQIIKALRETKQAVQVATAAVQFTQEQNDTADAKLNKVIQLVDGPLGEALKRIATRDATIFEIRGTAADGDRAEQSAAKSATHSAHASEVIAATDALAAATAAASGARKPPDCP